MTARLTSRVRAIALMVTALAMGALGSPVASAADPASGALAADAASGATAAAASRYTVKPGQSLNDVAIALTQSHDKAVLARAAKVIFDANPSAFMRGDPSLMKLGAVLNVPALNASGAVAQAPAAASVSASASAASASAVSTPAATGLPRRLLLRRLLVCRLRLRLRLRLWLWLRQARRRCRKRRRVRKPTRRHRLRRVPRWVTHGRAPFNLQRVRPRRRVPPHPRLTKRVPPRPRRLQPPPLRARRAQLRPRWPTERIRSLACNNCWRSKTGC